MRVCVGEVLEVTRGEIKSPLSLPDDSGNGTLRWRVENATVSGLANYSIGTMDVDVNNTSGVKIKFNVTWPRITLSAVGRYRYCVTDGGSTRCYWLMGQLTISVKNPLGSEDILLDLSGNDCKTQEQYKFNRTAVFDFRNVSVRIQLQTWNQAIARRIGFPYEKFEDELSTNYWKNRAGRVVDDAIQSVI